RDGKAIASTRLKLMLLKVDALFEKSFSNQEKNLMEMILVARTKRDLHLKLIRDANRKARKEKIIQRFDKGKSISKEEMQEFESKIASSEHNKTQPMKKNSSKIFGSI